MCGFSGLLVGNRSNPQSAEWESRFAEAAQKIAHRGTDDNRLIKYTSLLLNHFRLAFQDLESGRQPMLSRDGAHAITFNGEIYNHLELRKELENRHGEISWRTHSDTETLLEGWLREGAGFVDKLEGEFAFVVSRTDGSECFAARDHFGVKPLFFALAETNTRMFSDARATYTCTTPLLAFASEMKALPAKKIWNRDGALRQFVGLFEPICTPFENIIHCPPGGRIMATRQGGSQSNGNYRVIVTTRAQAVRNNNRTAFWSSDHIDHTLAEFRSALKHSVNERLLSDVELGVYLSGGIDSKAVAFELSDTLKSHTSSWKKGALKSFTVGFESAGYDESEEAVAFAKHLGFEPHVLTLSDSALNYSYPHAVYISENLQPFTNGAAKWWLSLFARQYVPGVLTGDGADELLCGYPSFRYCVWWAFSQRGRTPTTPLGTRWRDSVYVKRFLKQSENPWLAGSSAEGRGDDFEKSIKLWGVPHPLFEQIQTITEAILGVEEAGLWLASQGPSIRSWYLLGIENAQRDDQEFLLNPENALLLWQNYFCQSHLPVQILNWVGDRMEMANTLEGRTPFLSGSLRRLVQQLPDIALVQGFTDKAVLRKSYAQVFPRQFALTPKKQFNAPFIDFAQLRKQYDIDTVLEKMGISTQGNRICQVLMNESKSTGQQDLSARERYLRTHRISALQTLFCSAIVQRSLVEEVQPQRDLEFENLILQRGGIRS
jgi:asparagine synthase (glutamine-hydrolysing)